MTIQGTDHTGAAADTAVVQRVSMILRDRLYIEVPDTDTDLIGSGLIDSMTLVELLMALEQEFDVQLADEELDLDDFRSVNTVAAFVERHVRPEQ